MQILGDTAALFGGAALVGLAAGLGLGHQPHRLAGGGHGITPVLPIAWTDLLWAFACPIVAALVAAFAARLTALKLLGGMP